MWIAGRGINFIGFIVFNIIFKISYVQSAGKHHHQLHLLQHCPRWLPEYLFPHAATTSTYSPVVGTATSNLYTAQPTYYTTTQERVYANAPSTTTATYVQGGQTYVQGGQTYAVQGGQSAYVSGGQTYTSSAAHKAVAEEIPVESRIEYIPFEKKYIEYEQVEKVYQVPVEVEVIEYEDVVRNERVPIERTITDYYAVETQVEYIRREIEETIMVEEPVEKVYERVQYIPVETQIVHYPERDNYVPAKTQIRTEYVGVQGQSGVQASTVQQQATKVEGATYQTYSGAQSGSRVGATYVSGGSGVNVATSSYQPASYTTYTTGQQGYTVAGGPTYATGTYTTTQPQYTTQQYTTSSYPATYQTTYTTANQPAYTTTTGGYVTGGSGVRASGYVTGGSGVRGTTTYVSNGSNIKQTSYETNAGYY